MNVSFLGQLQELLDSVGKLSEKTGFLSDSAIVLNNGLIMRLSLFEDVDIDFT